MADYADTAAYPVYPQATVKQSILRDLQKYVHREARLTDIINRINRTDLTGATDGATNYAPEDDWALPE